MTKPLIRKDFAPTRSNRGRDTTPAERRSELVALLPKRQRLLYNPITSACVIPLAGGFGLYCGDEGYFVVTPSEAGFTCLPIDPDDARSWALAHASEGEFDRYHACLSAILRVHGIAL